MFIRPFIVSFAYIAVLHANKLRFFSAVKQTNDIHFVICNCFVFLQPQSTKLPIFSLKSFLRVSLVVNSVQFRPFKTRYLFYVLCIHEPPPLPRDPIGYVQTLSPLSLWSDDFINVLSFFRPTILSTVLNYRYRLPRF